MCLGVRAHSLNGMVGKPLGYISNLRCLVKPALRWLKSCGQLRKLSCSTSSLACGKDSRGQAETVVPWVGDVHESANYRKVASLLVSCSTITSMRGMFRLNGRAGGFGPASGWNYFLPVEL